MSDLPDRFERWAARFEEAGLTGKAMLVGGTAVRLTARLIDGALDRAASTVADAEHAFKRELDPNMEDAKVLDEWDERR
ncbi:MAG: hypothetical protein AAGI91_15985 [Bacteroidota bacterium]